MSDLQFMPVYEGVRQCEHINLQTLNICRLIFAFVYAEKNANIIYLIVLQQLPVNEEVSS